MNTQLRLVASGNVNRQVEAVEPNTLRRPTNLDLRKREYLFLAEVEKMVRAAREGRWGHRDACLIWTAYKHGLRAVEACGLEWSQVEFGRSPSLHVRRVKKGKSAVHPIRAIELRMLMRLRKDFPDSAYVFTTERGGPFTPDAINRLVKTIGAKTGIGFPVHFHMLRHGCGYAMANAGEDTRTIQDYLGHVSIQHTVRYTELSATKFKNAMRD